MSQKDFAKIKCTIWGSQKFKPLSDEYKLFYLYLHTNTRVNSCGCYYSPIGYMTVDLKWKESQVVAAICACVKAKLIRYHEPEDTVYIENFFSINAPQNPKHAIKLLCDIESIPYAPFKSACALELKRFVENSGWKIEKDFLYRIERVSTLDLDLDVDVDVDVDIIAEEKENKKTLEKKSISLEDLSIFHISDWLVQKRVGGKYLNIDENRLLEMFKDYCRSKNPKYKDFVAAFRNSFEWKNAPIVNDTKGKNGNGKFTAEDALADVFTRIDREKEEANRALGSPMLCDAKKLQQNP